MAASRAAVKSGIAPGMALADARAMQPSLIAVDADPAADGRALISLATWCGRYAPWVAVDNATLPGGGAGLLLDVTGCAHLFGGEAEMLEHMVARIGRLGLTARAAMAATPGAVRALARWATAERECIVAGEGETAAALAPLPAAALGIAPMTAASLSMLGLRTIGQLYGLPRAALAARFGDAVTAPLDRALGRIFEPISPDPPPAHHVVRIAFPEPIGRIEGIAAALDRLLAALCEGLEREGDGARRLMLSLYEPDGRTRRVHLGLSMPSRDAAHIARLFAPRLEDIDAAFGFDAMTLAATEIDKLAPQQVAETQGDTSTAVPTALIDALANRLGETNVLRYEARESHIPERAAIVVPAIASPTRTAAVTPFIPPAAPSRPLRLLPRPEPVQVMALLPHDPPAMFHWRRVAHRVARAEGPERIAPEWWRVAEDSDGKNEGSEVRDYWRLEDERGRRFWLYRLGLAWYLHGVYG